jgi:hypothetical protein
LPSTAKSAVWRTLNSGPGEPAGVACCPRAGNTDATATSGITQPSSVDPITVSSRSLPFDLNSAGEPGGEVVEPRGDDRHEEAENAVEDRQDDDRPDADQASRQRAERFPGREAAGQRRQRARFGAL